MTLNPNRSQEDLERIALGSPDNQDRRYAITKLMSDPVLLLIAASPWREEASLAIRWMVRLN